MYRDAFARHLMSKAAKKGIANGNELARACKFNQATTHNRLNDGKWTREQMMILHKVVGIDQEGIDIYLGKELAR